MKKEPCVNVRDLICQFDALYGEVTNEQIERYEKAFLRFKTYFGESGAYFASSSGRVEVCGNHTDHNGGVVISSAISLDTLAVFLPTDDEVIHILSEGYPEIVVKINGDEEVVKGSSSALVKGVVEGLKKSGYIVGGFKATFTSNVLGGAGVSSSASFEVLVAEILNFLYNESKIDCETKAKVSQFAENEYFGKPCGLLDQTAISFGGLKKLDFSDKNKISVKDIPCEHDDFVFVLINTGGNHADLTDEYASIPAEMREVAKQMGKERLIDIDKDEFFEKLPNISDIVSDRAILRSIHFYEENDRVNQLEVVLCENDLDKAFRLIGESGKSSLYKLQNCYVSGSLAQPIPKAIALAEQYNLRGATRVHGGGFAGSILSVVKAQDLDVFVEKMSAYYDRKDIVPLRIRSVGTIVL